MNAPCKESFAIALVPSVFIAVALGLNSSNIGATNRMDVDATYGAQQDPGQQEEVNNDQSGSPESVPLSVQPLDQATYPEDRPAWIDELPQFDSKSPAIAQWPVTSGPVVTAEIAEDLLQAQIRGALEAYSERVLGREAALVVLRNADYDFEPRVLSRYEGTVEMGNETAYEAAAMLNFDNRDATMLQEAWINCEREKRLFWLLSGVGTLLAACALGAIVSRHLTQGLRLENV